MNGIGECLSRELDRTKYSVLTINSSVKRTFQPLLFHPLFPLMQLLENVFVMHTRWLRPTWTKIWTHYFNDNFEANGRKAFEAHYASVKEMAPPENLLVYKVSEGWEPLCKFLGQPVPPQPYPTGNRVSVFQQRFRDAIFYNGKEMVEKLAKMMAIYLCFNWVFKKITKRSLVDMVGSVGLRLMVRLLLFRRKSVQ